VRGADRHGRPAAEVELIDMKAGQKAFRREMTQGTIVGKKAVWE